MTKDLSSTIFFSLFHANILQSFWPLLLIGSYIRTLGHVFVHCGAFTLTMTSTPRCPNVVECHQKSTPLAEVSFQHACKHLLYEVVFVADIPVVGLLAYITEPSQ